MFEDSADELLTIRDCVRFGASRFQENGLFFGHGTDNALDEAYAIALHVLSLPYQMPESYLDARVTRFERDALLAMFAERIERRVPVAYLTGIAWFGGWQFHVDERVLVPRSPIAELIERSFSDWFAEQPPARILDIGTGSGCIAIACALAMPDAIVDGSDIDADALEVAEWNVSEYGLNERVGLFQSDLFAQLPPVSYDLIVSNPPYVDAEDLADMPAEFHAEPGHALASGEDGLDHPLRILAGSANHLSEHGVLIVEVGNSEHALKALLPDLPLEWLQFERGGQGVFAIQRARLVEALPQIELVLSQRA